MGVTDEGPPLRLNVEPRIKGASTSRGQWYLVFNLDTANRMQCMRLSDALIGPRFDANKWGSMIGWVQAGCQARKRPCNSDN